MKRFALFSLLFFFIVGCVGLQPIPQETLSRIKKVGVISMLGNIADKKYIGITVFENKDIEIPVDEWKLDHFIIATSRNEFKTNPNIKFVEIDYSYDELKSMYKSMEKFPYRDYNLNIIKDKLSEIADRYKLDAFILVSRSRFEDPIQHAHMVYGYGIFQRNALIFKKTALYIVAKLTVLDSRTLNDISSFLIYSSTEVDNSYWGDDPKIISKDKKEFMEKWLKQEISRMLQERLKKIGLT